MEGGGGSKEDAEEAAVWLLPPETHLEHLGLSGSQNHRIVRVGRDLRQSGAEDAVR